MEEHDLWDALIRLGCLRPGHFRVGDEHADVALGSLDPLIDPVATEALARRLAAALADEAPDVVLAWAGLPSLLLGFAVGVTLGRPVVRLTDEEGLVLGSGPLRRGQRAVLVGETLSERDLLLAQAFAGWSGATLTRWAGLVDDGQAEGVVALASLRGRRYPTAECPLCRANVPLDQVLAGPSSRPQVGTGTG